MIALDGGRRRDPEREVENFEFQISLGRKGGEERRAFNWQQSLIRAVAVGTFSSLRDLEGAAIIRPPVGKSRMIVNEISSSRPH